MLSSRQPKQAAGMKKVSWTTQTSAAKMRQTISFTAASNSRTATKRRVSHTRTADNSATVPPMSPSHPARLCPQGGQALRFASAPPDRGVVAANTRSRTFPASARPSARAPPTRHEKQPQPPPETRPAWTRPLSPCASRCDHAPRLHLARHTRAEGSARLASRIAVSTGRKMGFCPCLALALKHRGRNAAAPWKRHASRVLAQAPGRRHGKVAASEPRYRVTKPDRHRKRAGTDYSPDATRSARMTPAQSA